MNLAKLIRGEDACNGCPLFLKCLSYGVPRNMMICKVCAGSITSFQEFDQLFRRLECYPKCMKYTNTTGFYCKFCRAYHAFDLYAMNPDRVHPLP